jgi:SAM-dependent methyltransferase
MIMETPVIDGIKCYAPDLAYDNLNYNAAAFKQFYELEANNFWFRSRNRVIQMLVRRFSDNSKIINFLEIGCGTGYVLKGLGKFKNLKLYGAEIYLEGLKYAKERLPDVEFIQLDATDMPFENYFECIGAFDVLEHIDEDEVVIKNVYNSLKQNGLFFISVPQYMFIWSYLDEIAHHKRRYNKNMLFRKLKNSGFDVIYNSSFVFSLFPVMIISRCLKKKSKLVDKTDTFPELQVNKFVNKILELILGIDELLIYLGIRLPFGGSLIAVAKKYL